MSYYQEGFHGLPSGTTGQDAPSSQWTHSLAADGSSRCAFFPPGSQDFGIRRFEPSFPFDFSVPPPPIGYGHLPGLPGSSHANAHFSNPVPPFPRFGFGSGPAAHTALPAADDSITETEIREQDLQWVQHFLSDRNTHPCGPSESRGEPQVNMSTVRESLGRVSELLSALTETRRRLELLVERDEWDQVYQEALAMREEIEGKLSLLTQVDFLDRVRKKLSRTFRRKQRIVRRKERLNVEARLREQAMAEKEANIDKWRAQQLIQVEEKKKEQELKLAADSVLCEVRKKQADSKRMQDILASLEKLHKLRKEAASRKGISIDPDSEESFNSQLENLRSVMNKRSAIYSVEENALMVMLEGEQEEERKRDRELYLKKEMDRRLQWKEKVASILFGDKLPVNPALLLYRDYYLQAQHSLHALVEMRKEWDAFLVAADHPEASTIPQNWVLPELPSDLLWDTAVLKSEPQ